MNPLAVKLENIQNNAGIKGVEVAQMLGTTAETISRWRNGKSQPQSTPLERLLKLEWLIQELSEFYEPNEARLWLYSHHKQLQGARPVDFIESGDLNKVLQIIDQLKSGAYI